MTDNLWCPFIFVDSRPPNNLPHPPSIKERDKSAEIDQQRMAGCDRTCHHIIIIFIGTVSVLFGRKDGRPSVRRTEHNELYLATGGGGGGEGGIEGRTEQHLQSFINLSQGVFQI